MRAIAELAVRMAHENPRWGYTRIQGALRNVGHRVGRTTWSQFLKAHWNVIATADFFTVEVWAPRGLVTFYVFFVIELATRKIEIAGITASPGEPWMIQIGRNLTEPLDGFLAEKRLLILVVRLPYRSPNLNAYAERFVRSIKDECLNLIGSGIIRVSTTD
jgi:putative transposase